MRTTPYFAPLHCPRALQTNPWIGVDLNARYEVQSVTLFAASAAGYPTYTSAHTFTVRITDIPAMTTSIDSRWAAPRTTRRV